MNSSAYRYDNTTYDFYMSFDNPIPQNGKIVLSLNE